MFPIPAMKTATTALRIHTTPTKLRNGTEKNGSLSLRFLLLLFVYTKLKERVSVIRFLFPPSSVFSQGAFFSPSMQEAKQDSVCISLIQRELAVLKQKVTKVCNINSLLLKQRKKAMKATKEAPNREAFRIALSLPTTRSLLTILYCISIACHVDGHSRESQTAFAPSTTTIPCCVSKLLASSSTSHSVASHAETR